MQGSPAHAPTDGSEHPPHLDVARLIRAARAARMMSQGELRRRTGMNDQTLYRIERGLNRPDSLSTLALIHELGIPPAVMRAAMLGDAQAVDHYITSELGAEAADAARAWAETFAAAVPPPPP